mgnify:CR=1 FL=1|tara:strand:- start:356 stop:754 length:399 start_codon:yes stop_codon:yes gene_type:complete
MPFYSEASRQKLSTCDERLQRLFFRVIDLVDITIVCGMRDEKAQNKAFAGGFSKVTFPNSRHNASPSLAVDWAPYPIDWEDRDRFLYVAGIIYGVAREMGIDEIRNGADWRRNGRAKRNNFDDLGHTEIKEG